jgi:hypothetical protein
LLIAEVALVLLPAICALIAFACVGLIARDARRRPSPDRLTWIVAFALFGIAAGAEVAGETAGWNTTLARLYYLTGAVLVVGFLALGQLYLLAADRIRRFAPGAALLLAAVSASTVWGAPLDRARLEQDGWDAITRTTGLTILAIGINSIGTLILLGGLLYSVARYRRAGTHRNRMIGCLLIAAGTLAVAMGGSLTRFGSDQYLYIAMSIGIALIFAGYVEAGRREAAPASIRGRLQSAPGREGEKASEREVGRLVGRPLRSLLSRQPNSEDREPALPGIAFIEQRLATRSDADLSEECRVWSVPAREIDAFSRVEARRVWHFRNRLGPAAQNAFDARPPSLRLQLAELYFDVMASEIAPISPIERPARQPVPDRSSTGSVD